MSAKRMIALVAAILVLSIVIAATALAQKGPPTAPSGGGTGGMGTATGGGGTPGTPAFTG